MKKNNKSKGFTLVELLATITILGIITLLSIPVLNNIQSRNSDKQFNTYKDSLVSSAKLYNDTYEEDLFGHKKNGCAIIYYSNLKRADLIKDIPNNDMTCYSNKTYVKVIKINEQYYYYPSLGCGNKKEGLLTDDEINYTLGDSEKTKIDDCTGGNGEVGSSTINLIAIGDSTGNFDRKIKTTKIILSTSIGIDPNARIYTAWSQDESFESVSNWQPLNISIPSLANQFNDISNGDVPITISSQSLRTPTGGNGEYYLHVRVDLLEDSNGESWVNPDEEGSKFLKFGPYKVDNTPPVFNDSTLVSNAAEYNSAKPTLKLKATDDNTSAANLRMCYSLDSDTCEKTSEAFIDETKYRKYQATIKNITFPGGTTLNGSRHKLYVTIIDEAKNYTSTSFDYQFAYSYTLTYRPNGGNACSPNKKAIMFNEGETKTWGELCSPTKTGHKFKEWNTSASGEGTKVTSESTASSNLTVSAVWQPNVCHITYDPNEGRFTNNETNTSMNCNYSTDEDCTPNMRDANGGYYSAVREGYTIVPGAEWIREDGTTYNETNAYKATDFCDGLADGDKNVNLKVNWIYAKPATPTIYNPSGGEWTKTNFALTVKTTTPAEQIGYWYYSYNNSEFVRYDNVNYNSYGKNNFTTSDFEVERDATAYIRVCNKYADGPNDLRNCSDSATTPIKIDRTPPYVYYDGFDNCAAAPGFSHCFTPSAKDDGSGVYNVWLTTNSGFSNYEHGGGPYTVWREALNTNANQVCFYWNKLCDYLGNCTTSRTPENYYCWPF